MKKFEKDGFTIVFYQAKNDDKYSFLVENNQELTDALNNAVKTKRIKEDGIKYAVRALFEKISEITKGEYNSSITIVENSTNPIVELSEYCQKHYGKNIETKVIGKAGPDHCPVITVQIELPNGYCITSGGINQKEAKKKAAIQALKIIRES